MSAALKAGRHPADIRHWEKMAKSSSAMLRRQPVTQVAFFLVGIAMHPNEYDRNHMRS
jgi:hypothetical protein